MLNQLSALGTGDNQGRRNLSTIRLRDGIGPFVIGALGQWRINFSQYRGATFSIRPDHDAIGIKKVGDSRTFAKKLWVGRDIEFAALSSVAQDDLTNPIAGIDRDRALFDYDLVVSDCAGDTARHRLDIREISLALLGRRSTDSYKDRRTCANRRLQITGEMQFRAAVPL